MTNRGKVHQMKAMQGSFPRGVMKRMNMKLRCSFHGKRTRGTTGKGGSMGSQEKKRGRSRSSTTLRPGTIVSRKGCTTKTSKTEASSGGTVAEICARKLDNPYWDAGGEELTRGIWAGHARPS